MPEPHPVSELMEEHRLIERVMSALERRLDAGEAFPAEFVAQCLDFFTEFADLNHHFKEEGALFPALASRGVPVEGGPIGRMLHEHNLGREFLAGIRAELEAARLGDPRAITSAKGCAAQYIELLRQHIWKEDNILFRMAQQVLDGASAQEITAQFQQGGQCAPEITRRHAEFAAAL